MPTARVARDAGEHGEAAHEPRRILAAPRRLEADLAEREHGLDDDELARREQALAQEERGVALARAGVRGLARRVRGTPAVLRGRVRARARRPARRPRERRDERRVLAHERGDRAGVRVGKLAPVGAAEDRDHERHEGVQAVRLVHVAHEPEPRVGDREDEREPRRGRVHDDHPQDDEDALLHGRAVPVAQVLVARAHREQRREQREHPRDVEHDDVVLDRELVLRRDDVLVEARDDLRDLRADLRLDVLRVLRDAVGRRRERERRAPRRPVDRLALAPQLGVHLLARQPLLVVDLLDLGRLLLELCDARDRGRERRLQARDAHVLEALQRAERRERQQGREQRSQRQHAGQQRAGAGDAWGDAWRGVASSMAMDPGAVSSWRFVEFSSTMSMRRWDV